MVANAIITPSLHTSAFIMGTDASLMTWGQLMFKVFPLNFHEMDHETASDWAHKEIAGAPIYREWVGENDESIFIRGKLFPFRIGGMSEIEAFEAYRRGGISNTLVRGDGAMLGWFVCEKLTRNHTHISGYGVGQQINFEATLARVPMPDPATYAQNMWGTVGA